jgi:hypothetical protein
MTPPRRTPSREHDLRMHLGVILMALQMINRPPTTPLQADQQELVDIMKRAAKSMEALLESSGGTGRKKSAGGTRTG